jgi:hypothetical protein
VRNIATRAVDIHHVKRLIAGIRELVKHRGRKEHRLSGGDLAALLADADFPTTFEDHVDLFLKKKEHKEKVPFGMYN